MNDDGKYLKISTPGDHSPGVLLALGLRITKIISSSIGGLQLQKYGSTNNIRNNDSVSWLTSVNSFHLMRRSLMLLKLLTEYCSPYEAHHCYPLAFYRVTVAL